MHIKLRGYASDSTFSMPVKRGGGGVRFIEKDDLVIMSFRLLHIQNFTRENFLIMPGLVYLLL